MSGHYANARTAVKFTLERSERSIQSLDGADSEAQNKNFEVFDACYGVINRWTEHVSEAPASLKELCANFEFEVDFDIDFDFDFDVDFDFDCDFDFDFDFDLIEHGKCNPIDKSHDTCHRKGGAPSTLQLVSEVSHLIN